MSNSNIMGEVHEYVLANGPCTIREVTAAVRSISAQQAATAGRSYLVTAHKSRQEQGGKRRPLSSYSLEETCRHGRREIVNHILCRLFKRSKIARVARGVYGPPLPKLYTPKTA